MRTVILTAMAGLLSAALMAPPAFAACTAGNGCADSCGGRVGFGGTPACPTPPTCSRAVSANGVILATYPGNTLSATLAAGKPGTILIADGMLTDVESVPVSREYDLGSSVNSLPMQPEGFAGPGGPEAHEDCGVFRTDPDRTCTVIGHWWLDMDDPANAALLGVPITVTLVGGDISGGAAVGGAPVDMSLRVHLQKK